MLHRALSTSLLFLVFAAVPVVGHAQAPLTTVTGAGAGPHMFGTSCLSRNDDGSTASIDITPAFPTGLHFFAGTYTNMFVNTNGNITFNANVPTYTAMAFPVAAQPMIAPFWADVDTRRSRGTGILHTCNAADPASGYTPGDGAGACDYTNDTDGSIWWYLEPGRIVVTWENVGYFLCHGNHRNAFQLILSAAASTCGGGGVGGGNFDVEFRYNRCEWETGDASGGTGGFGGTPAQAGFDAGDSVNYVAIPGSLMPGIATMLCSGSNLSPAMPGVWHFGVRGGVVMCPDAGVPCSTGMLGVCADGRTQCVMSGTMCEPTVTASPERCDALDNDCNGMVDDGSGLCPGTEICEAGTCVPPCFERSCTMGQTCNADGHCVDTACATVTCPSGQRCVGGACVGACDGITCPAGEECRAGACVDSCLGVTCATGDVCEAGVCLPPCPCRMCGAGQECTTDGHCVDTGCAATTCAPGTVCTAGSCVDACIGAVCPSGQMCAMGVCVDMPDAGPPPTPDAGPVSGPDASTSGTDGGASGDASASPDAGTCRMASCHPTHVGSGGCCSAAGASSSSALWPVALIGLMILVPRKRRKRVG